MTRRRGYTPMGKQVIVSVTLPLELAQLVDEAAERRGLSRSAFLRQAAAAQIERDVRGEAPDCDETPQGRG